MQRVKWPLPLPPTIVPGKGPPPKKMGRLLPVNAEGSHGPYYCAGPGGFNGPYYCAGPVNAEVDNYSQAGVGV